MPGRRRTHPDANPTVSVSSAAPNDTAAVIFGRPMSGKRITKIGLNMTAPPMPKAMAIVATTIETGAMKKYLRSTILAPAACATASLGRGPSRRHSSRRVHAGCVCRRVQGDEAVDPHSAQQVVPTRASTRTTGDRRLRISPATRATAAGEVASQHEGVRRCMMATVHKLPLGVNTTLF